MAPIKLVIPSPRLLNWLKGNGLKTILEVKIISIKRTEVKCSNVRRCYVGTSFRFLLDLEDSMFLHWFGNNMLHKVSWCKRVIIRKLSSDWLSQSLSEPWKLGATFS